MLGGTYWNTNGQYVNRFQAGLFIARLLHYVLVEDFSRALDQSLHTQRLDNIFLNVFWSLVDCVVRVKLFTLDDLNQFVNHHRDIDLDLSDVKFLLLRNYPIKLFNVQK